MPKKKIDGIIIRPVSNTKDPHRPDQPNKLYFFTPSEDCGYCWELRDFEDNDLAYGPDFDTMEEAIDNAIATFGKEIWAGYHEAVEEEHHQRILAAGISIERGANR